MDKSVFVEHVVSCLTGESRVSVLRRFTLKCSCRHSPRVRLGDLKADGFPVGRLCSYLPGLLSFHALGKFFWTPFRLLSQITLI